VCVGPSQREIAPGLQDEDLMHRGVVLCGVVYGAGIRGGA
jgi:hypothetical protein